MFNIYPYDNLTDLNLDFILKSIRELTKIVKTFVGLNTITFADPIIWDITTQYSPNTIVLNTSGNAYLSKVPIPAGVQLNNSDYWLEIFNFTEYTRTANQNLTVNVETNTTESTHAYNVDDWLIWNDVLYKVTSAIAVGDELTVDTNIVHFTVEDFIKAFMTWATNTIQQYKNDIDASELQYRQQLAGDIADTTASLQAQLNAAIAGATVDSEVINARIGWDNTSYSTLGDAIRAQITYLHNEIDGLTYTPNYTIINDYFIQSNGSYVSATGFTATNLIDVSVVDRIILQNSIYLDNRRICFYNELKQKVSDIQYTNENMVIVVPSGAKYVGLSSGFTSIRFAISFQKLMNYIKDYYENGTPQEKTFTLIYDEFANYTNGQFNTLAGSSARTDYIDVSDCEYIEITTRMTALAGICFYDSSYNFVQGYNNVNSVVPLNIYNLHVPDNAKFVVVSYLFGSAPQVYDVNDVKIIGRVYSFDIWNILTSFTYKPNYTLINDHFIQPNGSYDSAAGFTATNLIDVSVVDRIILQNSIYLDNRRICFYNELKQKVSDIQYTNENMVIDVPSGAKYVGLSNGFTSIRFAPSFKKLIDYIKTYYENGTPQEKTFTLIYDEFANYTNGQFNTLAGSSARTDYIDVSDCESVEITTRMVSAAGICFYDSLYNFVQGYNNVNSVVPLNIYNLHVPDNAKFVVVSYLFGSAPQVYDVNDVKVVGHTNIFNVWKKTKTPFNILGAFDHITCCGDSLTWGAVYTSANAFRQAYRPYPTVLCDLVGADMENIAAGGESAASWFTHYFNRITAKSNQLAIIYLGTNLGLTETLDTDAPTSDPPTSWNTSTNTGSFARIIKEFIDKGAKVLLIKCYATSGTGSADLTHTNNTITAAANRFKCGLIENDELADVVYHYYPDLSGNNSVHYNDLGYAAFANYLIKQVSDMPTTYKRYIIPT